MTNTTYNASLTAYNEDAEPGRIERLERVRRRYGMFSAATLLALHDHKGCLSVNFRGSFRARDERLIREAWAAEGEHDVRLYVDGERASNMDDLDLPL